MASLTGNPETKPNYLYSIISVALVLFLLGFFGLLILHAQQLVNLFKEKVNVMVEIKPDTVQKDIFILKKKLEEETYVKEGSVYYTSKEDAAALLRDDFGDDFLNLDMQNPLYDVINFNIKAADLDQERLALIKKEIKSNEFVSDVYYQEGLVDSISGNIQKVGWLSLLIGGLFVLVAVYLIHNTIRLAIYSNRFLIKNMELVGATWSFISRPYIMRSIKHGILSALLAIVGLVVLMAIARNDLPEIKALENYGAFTTLFFALIFLGVLITSLSTYYVVHKYLKTSVDELY